MNAVTRLSRALRVLLLAAFVLQCLAVQTHVHFAQVLAKPNASPPAVATSSLRRPGDAADYCLLCREAAMAGHYFRPSAVAVPTPPPSLFWTVVAAVVQFTLYPRPLGWLSRAPPR